MDGGLTYMDVSFFKEKGLSHPPGGLARIGGRRAFKADPGGRSFIISVNALTPPCVLEVSVLYTQ
jgi:hypothetical protein